MVICLDPDTQFLYSRTDKEKASPLRSLAFITSARSCSWWSRLLLLTRSSTSLQASSSPSAPLSVPALRRTRLSASRNVE